MMTEVNHVVDVSRDAAGAYMFDGYVLPAHRRKGALRALLRSSKGWALQHGISRLYAAFARENHVSEHALLTAGFGTIVGDVSILRVLGREWKWVRLPRRMPIFDVLSADGPSRFRPRPA
jgi:GNAT superfamily N-acetyltransferase